MVQKLTYLLAATVALTIAISSFGCNKKPSLVSVSGKVLIDGKPLQHGTIGFVPTQGRAARSNIDSEGRFTMMTYDKEGVAPGTHRIEVKAFEQIGKAPPSVFKWHAPQKYGDFQTSGLTETITGPTDSIVIKLEWPKGEKPFVTSD